MLRIQMECCCGASYAVEEEVDPLYAVATKDAESWRREHEDCAMQRWLLSPQSVVLSNAPGGEAPSGIVTAEPAGATG